MPLWGKEDNANSAPKFLSDSNDATPQTDVDNAYFVDTEEAGVTANRAKGLQTPGWNLYTTYTDSDGATRHRVETLVPMKVAAVDAGDLGVSGNTDIEDTVVEDPA